MTVIYLVRHGQAEVGWNAHEDPGLSEGEECTVCFQPLPGSCTTLERMGDSFRVIGGAEGASTVL